MLVLPHGIKEQRQDNHHMTIIFMTIWNLVVERRPDKKISEPVCINVCARQAVPSFMSKMIILILMMMMMIL